MSSDPSEKEKQPEQEIDPLEKVLAPGFAGRHEWPIEVEFLGETVRLRLMPGKKRICIDWYISKEFREVVGRTRIMRQVERQGRNVPPHEDPGRNPDLAIGWARQWLSDQIYEAQAKLRTQADVRDQTIPNNVPLTHVLDKFRESTKFDGASEQQQAQWELWMDFFRSVLPTDFRVRHISPDELHRLMSRYQGSWTRRHRDGTEEVVATGAGHNSAAKVIRFLKLVCTWGLSVPEREGYLVDADPFQRISADHWRQFREQGSRSRSVESASDEFVEALLRKLTGVGETGQPVPIFGVQAAIGRRLSEVRELRRTHLLTTEEEIRQGLSDQGCRRALKAKHLPANQLDEAARAYAEVGWAMHFTTGKQLTRHPDALQHDRVVPLGARLTALLKDYLETHWEPLRLEPDAPLFPAARDHSKPTGRSVAANWFKRARKVIAAMDDAPPIPDGGTHTLRHRFRDAHADEPKKLVAFVGGWTLRQSSSMDEQVVSSCFCRRG